MRFILKVDKDDCYQTAEITELSAVEVLIINKAIRMLSEHPRVSESDRRIAVEMGKELLREDAVVYADCQWK